MYAEISRPQVVLVDYENVNDLDPSKLKGFPVTIVLFLGSHQPKISTDLVVELSKSGVKHEFHQAMVAGKNALAFVVAYHAGRLSVQHPDAFIHILSKDSGLTALLQHMRDSGVCADQPKAFDEINLIKKDKPKAFDEIKLIKKDKPKSNDELFSLAVEHLSKRVQGRPGREKALMAMLRQWFGQAILDARIQTTINRLKHQGMVKVDGKGKVSYHLTKPKPVKGMPTKRQ